MSVVFCFVGTKRRIPNKSYHTAVSHGRFIGKGNRSNLLERKERRGKREERGGRKNKAFLRPVEPV